MNTLELQVIRLRKGVGQAELARKIGLQDIAYRNREYGKVKFSASEILAVVKELGLTYDQFNMVFFDGQLPFAVASREEN